MSNNNFYEKPYDEGTISKLKIFELYAQEWIPVFTAKPEPDYNELHIFDFFSGPGRDMKGEIGSPLRILRQLKNYSKKNLHGWEKIRKFVHFSDYDMQITEKLREELGKEEWSVPGIKIETDIASFEDPLRKNRSILEDKRMAKLLIIDQFGVDAVSDGIFKQLTTFPVTDFIFFLSSSTLHRFRDHPAIKIKIDDVDSSYDVHRAAFEYFKKMSPVDFFLGRFSIKKKSNIYGLVFGSKHPLGIHKFLQVAWKEDNMAGEANFDIEGENIKQRETLLLHIIVPKKIEKFEGDLKIEIENKNIKSETDIIRFCLNAGMTCQHSTPLLKELKRQKIIECAFDTPNIANFKKPRPVTYL
ncbi:MAG: three-Cys-motif partner protein TcmP [Puniceicoccales bacterium]|jgi:three-Cys-motif partner protein|nr:three-Cys-motif partner protein TcmP [Puniceicoccales bacterium]